MEKIVASNITPLNAEVHYDKQGVHAPDSPYSKLDKLLGGNGLMTGKEYLNSLACVKTDKKKSDKMAALYANNLPKSS